MPHELSRRDFLLQSVLYGGALWTALSIPRPRAFAAAAADPTPRVLSPEAWTTIEAITGRIIPTDHEPGAIEARCVNFIDKALANEDAAARPLYEAGVAGVDAVARQQAEKPFADLDATAQDALLRALAAGTAAGWPAGPVASPLFFETIRMHTIVGFLADPSYGGNHDFVGWKVTGYPGGQHHHGGYTRAQMVGQSRIVPVWERRGA